MAAERDGLRERSAPPFVLSYTPAATPAAVMEKSDKIPVAMLREEGSNGDREMAATFLAAGFEPWDVAMSDLLAGRITLERFRGVVAVGGFAHADVLDAGKGWAGSIRFNHDLWAQFEAFLDRPDTFSLGVCNGCQLLALLGWVPWRGLEGPAQPRFVRNASGRFESRFATVTIQTSPAIMLRGMEGSTLGIWSAHGEGRALFPDPAILDEVEAQSLAPIRFVDDGGAVTETLPPQPQRVAAGHRRSVLARRAAPRHDAPPRTHLHDLALGMDATGVERPRGLAVAADVPERPRVVRGRLNVQRSNV